MAAWYECKVSYLKTLENGKQTKVSEVYLVDAVSFTEAESRIYKELGELLGEFNLDSVKKARVSELIHNENAYKWYKVKVNLTTVDEKSGKEIKSNQIILTSAESLKDAYDSVEDLFSGTVDDHEIVEIAFTPIVEIFPFYMKKVEEKVENEAESSTSEEKDEYISEEA